MHLCIQTWIGFLASELVQIEFVRIANHQIGASVSEQFRYRDPSAVLSNTTRTIAKNVATEILLSSHFLFLGNEM